MYEKETLVYLFDIFPANAEQLNPFIHAQPYRDGGCFLEGYAGNWPDDRPGIHAYFADGLKRGADGPAERETLANGANPVWLFTVQGNLDTVTSRPSLNDQIGCSFDFSLERGCHTAVRLKQQCAG